MLETIGKYFNTVKYVKTLVDQDKNSLDIHDIVFQNWIAYTFMGAS